MGRPTKLTPEIQKAICDMLEIAVAEKHAAEANGIAEQTFHEWMRRGEAGESPYDDFYVAATRARARAIPNLHIKALQGGKGSSQALWFLERRFREEYGPSQRIEHAGSIEGERNNVIAILAASAESHSIRGVLASLADPIQAGRDSLSAQPAPDALPSGESEGGPGGQAA